MYLSTHRYSTAQSPLNCCSGDEDDDDYDDDDDDDDGGCGDCGDNNKNAYWSLCVHASTRTDVTPHNSKFIDLRMHSSRTTGGGECSGLLGGSRRKFPPLTTQRCGKLLMNQPVAFGLSVLSSTGRPGNEYILTVVRNRDCAAQFACVARDINKQE
jgi:hypothetical protein